MGHFSVSPGFTGFLLGFAEFYWVLPSFTGFYRVLLGFTECCQLKPSFIELYQVLAGGTVFNRVLLCFTWFERV